MGTANYGWTYLIGTNKIDLVGDTTVFLDEIDASLKTVADAAGGAYTLPTASSTTLGGIKTGTANGTTGYVTVTTDGKAYVPVMSASNMGVGKPDADTITVASGVISVSDEIQTAIATNTTNVASLTTDIASVKTNVETNTTSINSLTTSVSANTSNISSLITSVNTNTTDINELTTRVATLEAALAKFTTGTTYAQLAASGFTYQSA